MLTATIKSQKYYKKLSPKTKEEKIRKFGINNFKYSLNKNNS